MECSICHKNFKQKNLFLKHLKLKKPCKIEDFKIISEKLNEIKNDDYELKQKQLETVLNQPIEMTARQLYDKQRYVPVKNVVRKKYVKKNELILVYDCGIQPIWTNHKNTTRRNRQKYIDLKNRDIEYADALKLIAKKVPELQTI